MMNERFFFSSARGLIEEKVESKKKSQKQKYKEKYMVPLKGLRKVHSLPLVAGWGGDQGTLPREKCFHYIHMPQSEM